MRDEGRADLGDAVGKRELQLGDQKLLDVGAADVVALLDLNHTENLYNIKSGSLVANMTLDVRG